MPDTETIPKGMGIKMEKNKEITFQVLTLAVLASEGIKIARLSGNRNFDEKVVKAK